jgi:hypothetical protein
MRARDKFKTTSKDHTTLPEQTKDILLWFYGQGVNKVLDNYTYHEVGIEPQNSMKALGVLSEDAKKTKDAEMQHEVSRLAVAMWYMHSPQEVNTPKGPVLLPAYEHKEFPQ